MVLSSIALLQYHLGFYFSPCYSPIRPGKTFPSLYETASPLAFLLSPPSDLPLLWHFQNTASWGSWGPGRASFLQSPSHTASEHQCYPVGSDPWSVTSLIIIIMFSIMIVSNKNTETFFISIVVIRSITVQRGNFVLNRDTVLVMCKAFV